MIINNMGKGISGGSNGHDSASRRAARRCAGADARNSLNGEGKHYETVLEGSAQGEKGACFAGTVLCDDSQGREQNGGVSSER